MSTYVNDPHVNIVIASSGRIETQRRDIAEVAQRILGDILGTAGQPSVQSMICSLRTAKKKGHLRFVRRPEGGYTCETSPVRMSGRRRTDEKPKRVTRGMLASAADACAPDALRRCKISA